MKPWQLKGTLYYHCTFSDSDKKIYTGKGSLKVYRLLEVTIDLLLVLEINFMFLGSPPEKFSLN